MSSFNINTNPINANYSSRQPDNFFTSTPDVVQQDSHILQTQVHKPLKKKYVNIDTKFQNSETGYGNKLGQAVFNAVLPQRITEVQTLSVKCMEVPYSFYNFSQALQNTFFTFQWNNGQIKTVTIPDNTYSTPSSLITAVNTALTALDASLNITISSNQTTAILQNNHNTGSVVFTFDIDPKGNYDKNNFKSKLGWELGFRNIKYTILPTKTQNSESFININTVKYLYLAIQENPNQGNPNSFVCPLFQSYINKDIVARIAVDTHFFPFGTVIDANYTNGYLLPDKRTYHPGKLALQNLQLQLLTDNGTPINLNGQDFSFIMELEHY